MRFTNTEEFASTYASQATFEWGRDQSMWLQKRGTGTGAPADQ